tara:strand:- start:323 stop:493 length:171 start_codon:yes stop_codon:yes gene_type:complete
MDAEKPLSLNEELVSGRLEDFIHEQAVSVAVHPYIHGVDPQRLLFILTRTYKDMGF